MSNWLAPENDCARGCEICSDCACSFSRTVAHHAVILLEFDFICKIRNTSTSLASARRGETAAVHFQTVVLLMKLRSEWLFKGESYAKQKGYL